MKSVLKKYEMTLKNMDFEVLQTQKLGWIILRTDYMNYSNPIIQIHSSEELEKYILSAKQIKDYQ